MLVGLKKVLEEDQNRKYETQTEREFPEFYQRKGGALRADSGDVFSKIYKFSYGLLNASVGTSSFNSHKCTKNLDLSKKYIDKLGLEFDSYLFEIAAVTIKDFLKTIHPIYSTCYQSIFEYRTGFLNYISTLSDAKKLLYNLVHNLG